MNALITITHRNVEHTDPNAAGFTDGWWWTVTSAIGEFESAGALFSDAENAAMAAAGHATSIERVIGLELLSRSEDEERVKAMVSAWRGRHNRSTRRRARK